MLDLNQKSYKCDCSNVHQIDCEILLNKGAINRINLLLKKYYAVSRIAVVYDKATYNHAQKVLDILANNDFQTSEICYEKLTYPTKSDSERLINLSDDIRFIIGIGGGSVAEIVRYSAFIRKNDYGIVATSPSTDSYLDSICVFNDKVIKASSPKFVICDDDIYLSAPDELVASGIASVFNCYLSLFNLIYNMAINKAKYCKTLINDLAKLLDEFLEKYHQSSTSKQYLMEVLLKLSMARCFIGKLDSSADKMCYILSSQEGSKLYGENLFLSCYLMVNLYKEYLSKVSLDTLLPADYVKGIKLLNLKLNNEYSYPNEKFANYKEQNITAIGFLIKEYREDFLEYISKIDYEGYAKLFRRCYKDAGFWLKNYVKATDLLSALSLSGLICEDSLSSYLKETGFMEEML